jgi:hypothetical protein
MSPLLLSLSQLSSPLNFHPDLPRSPRSSIGAAPPSPPDANPPRGRNYLLSSPSCASSVLAPRARRSQSLLRCFRGGSARALPQVLPGEEHRRRRGLVAAAEVAPAAAVREESDTERERRGGCCGGRSFSY